MKRLRMCVGLDSYRLGLITGLLLEDVRQAAAILRDEAEWDDGEPRDVTPKLQTHNRDAFTFTEMYLYSKAKCTVENHRTLMKWN
jgi:hypothetical protein